MEWNSVLFGFLLCFLLQRLVEIGSKIKSIRIDFKDEKPKEIENHDDKKQLGE